MGFPARSCLSRESDFSAPNVVRTDQRRYHHGEEGLSSQPQFQPYEVLCWVVLLLLSLTLMLLPSLFLLLPNYPTPRRAERHQSQKLVSHGCIRPSVLRTVWLSVKLGGRLFCFAGYTLPCESATALLSVLHQLPPPSHQYYSYYEYWFSVLLCHRSARRPYPCRFVD